MTVMPQRQSHVRNREFASSGRYEGIKYLAEQGIEAGEEEVLGFWSQDQQSVITASIAYGLSIHELRVY